MEHSLPKTGFLRLSQIIGNSKAKPPIPALIPVSRATWYEGVRTSRFPAPVKTLGPQISLWRVEDIRELIDNLSKGTVPSNARDAAASEQG
jgi:predicted DNA-binding transcriptional regulator AlpA